MNKSKKLLFFSGATTLGLAVILPAIPTLISLPVFGIAATFYFFGSARNQISDSISKKGEMIIDKASKKIESSIEKTEKKIGDIFDKAGENLDRMTNLTLGIVSIASGVSLFSAQKMIFTNHNHDSLNSHFDLDIFFIGSCKLVSLTLLYSHLTSRCENR